MSDQIPGPSRTCVILNSDSDGYNTDRELGKKSSQSRIVDSKKRKFHHKYRLEWETHNDFKNWLGPSKKGELFFNCKVCDYDNKGGLSAVKKHSKTEKHLKNLNSIKSSKSIKSMFVKPDILETQAKEGELRVAAYIAEHNIAFRTSDHLIKLIKSVCTDSNIAKKMSCTKCKCRCKILNVQH